jgi:hypothetical protein
LPRFTVRAVERRANGDYAILIRRPRAGSHAALAMPRWTWGRRVLRIPARRVEGYRPRSPYVRPRDARARRKQNAWRMALWLAFKTDFDAPAARRALDGDLEAIAELRAAILGAAPPEPELEVVFAVFLGSNGDGGKRAA